MDSTESFPYQNQQPKEIKNPVKAIRSFCIECMGGSSEEVKKCPSTKCKLHAFRKGRNPYRSERVLTDEQKEVMTNRLASARAAKAS